MFANFLKRFFNSCPSVKTSSFLGFVEATALELEPLDSLIGLRFWKDSAKVAYTNLISLRFLVMPLGL